MKIFNQMGELIEEGLAGFESWWRGGFDVALSESQRYISSGVGRRVSVRPFEFGTSSVAVVKDESQIGANPTSGKQCLSSC